MKLALIAPTEIPSRRANSFQVMKMAQAIACLGHDVHLVVPAVGTPGSYPRHTWSDLEQFYGIHKQFHMTWLKMHPSLRRYDFGFAAVNLACKWGAEIIYTRLPQAAVIAGRRGMTTVLEAHDLPKGVMGRRLFQHYLRTPGARRLVSISRALSEDLSQHFGFWGDRPDLLIAPDGVDLERFADLPDECTARKLIGLKTVSVYQNFNVRFDPELFTAGYTGHLYPGRGRDLILQLAAHFPRVNFLLIGGEERDIEALRQEIQARDLTNVTATGFIPNAELPLYQAACEVLLMPYQDQVSASSGGDIARYLSPLKMFEYLATGRVIFSSDLPVLGEVLTSHNAVILPRADLQAWIDALQAIQEHPEHRRILAQQAKATAQNYSWERRAERILAGLV